MEKIYFRHGEWRLHLPCPIGATIYYVGCGRIHGIPFNTQNSRIIEHRFNLSHLDPYTGELKPHYYIDYEDALEYQEQLPLERERKIMELRGEQTEK